VFRNYANEVRELGQMNQCLYCLTQALKVDPSDVEALWELANIHRAQDNKLKVSLALGSMSSMLS
jgi:cytochrome c-type biogenesis protein CcmH/NrfG